MTAHKFKVAQAVEFQPTDGVFAPRGMYLVTACLPERNGEFEYRIKHPAEEHQRIGRESELRGIADDGERPRR